MSALYAFTLAQRRGNFKSTEPQTFIRVVLCLHSLSHYLDHSSVSLGHSLDDIGFLFSSALASLW